MQGKRGLFGSGSKVNRVNRSDSRRSRISKAGLCMVAPLHRGSTRSTRIGEEFLKVLFTTSVVVTSIDLA